MIFGGVVDPSTGEQIPESDWEPEIAELVERFREAVDPV